MRRAADRAVGARTREEGVDSHRRGRSDAFSFLTAFASASRSGFDHGQLPDFETEKVGSRQTRSGTASTAPREYTATVTRRSLRVLGMEIAADPTIGGMAKGVSKPIGTATSTE